MPGNKPHTHESIRLLMTEAIGDETPADVIRRKARQIISKHSHWWKGPPFCPIELADLEGIKVREATCDIKSDGRIFHIGDQVYIEYATGQSDERVRFTISHELAHTLFADWFKRERRRSQAEKDDWEFENLCHIGASEFLFPIDAFSSDLGTAKVPAVRIKELASLYKASVDATSRRIIHLQEHPACVVFAQYKEPVGKSVVSLSVQYAVPNSRFPHKIYRGLKINSKSVANHAYATKEPASASQENWNIAGTWGRFRVEAVPLPKFESKDTADVAIMLYA